MWPLRGWSPGQVGCGLDTDVDARVAARQWNMTTHATTQPEMIDTPTTGTSSVATRWGIAALVKAATYIVGFGVMGAPRTSWFVGCAGDPSASLSFLLDNQAAMCSWYLVLYLVGGIALVSLVLGCTTYSVARLRRCR